MKGTDTHFHNFTFFSCFRMASPEMFDNRSIPLGGSLAEEVTHDPSLKNVTQSYNTDSYHPITAFIETYTIPVISIFGLIGNTIASLVFLQKKLRNNSCSIFLAARGFSDNGFLSTLIIIWISRTCRLQLGMVNGSCRIIIFLSYVCGCISAWLVVFVTVENYFRICRPFLVSRFCTIKGAKISVVILCINTVGFYNFPFWAMSSDDCVPYDEYQNTVQAFIYIDIVITLILPLICIVLVMSAILCVLLKSYKIRNRHKLRTTKTVKSPMAKVTNMLLAVTLTFFCFCLPSHVNRIRLMLSNTEGTKVYNSLHEEAIQQITLLIYYLSLSTNIIIYTIFGSRFRSVCKSMFTVSSVRKKALRRVISEKKQDLAAMVNEINAFPEKTNVRQNLAVSISNVGEPFSEIVCLHKFELS